MPHSPPLRLTDTYMPAESHILKWIQLLRNLQALVKKTVAEFSAKMTKMQMAKMPKMDELMEKDLQLDTAMSLDPPRPIQFISLQSGKFAISPEAEAFFQKLEEIFSSPNCKFELLIY